MFDRDLFRLHVLYCNRSVSDAVLMSFNFCICVKWCAIRVLFEFTSMGERKIPRWESHIVELQACIGYELYLS